MCFMKMILEELYTLVPVRFGMSSVYFFLLQIEVVYFLFDSLRLF